MRTGEDWRRVGFSDESLFCCQDAGRRLAWHKHRHLRLSTLIAKFPTKVMVWSLMSYKGVGPLHIVEGTMNSAKYIEMMSDHRLPLLQDRFPEGDAVFMHDGAPHTAKMSVKFLGAGMEVLDWPDNSPDLNPIEAS